MPQLKKLPWGDYIDPHTIVSVETFRQGPTHSRPWVRLRLAKNGAGFDIKSPVTENIEQARQWAEEIAGWQMGEPYR